MPWGWFILGCVAIIITWLVGKEDYEFDTFDYRGGR